MLSETAMRNAPCASADPDRLLFALSQRSLHRRFFGKSASKTGARTRGWLGRDPRRQRRAADDPVDPLSFPAVARELGFDAAEIVGGFYAARIHQRAYVRDLRLRCDDEGVAALILHCPSEGPIDDPSPLRRERVADRHWTWIEAATLLGCRAIRVTLSGDGDPAEQARLAADGLHTLATRAWCRGVDVIVGDDGGLSSSPVWLARVLRLADHPRLGSQPDVASFAAGTADACLAVLLPYVRGVNARFLDFDDAGEETSFDCERLLRLLIGGGWAGPIGVSYEGDRLGEPDGVRAAKTLLERHRRMLERTSARLN